MVHNNLYFEECTSISAKGRNSVCGDIVRVYRSVAGTLCVLCDGLGGGISANLAAELAVSRLIELVKSGFSSHESFLRVAESIQQARGVSSTYAAMTAVFVRPDGAAAVLGYEAPPVLWISRNRKVSRPRMTSERVGKVVIEHGSCFLEPGEALMLMSDGITQAGLGSGYPNGLPSEEIAELMELRLRENPAMDALASFVHKKALTQWGGLGGDDCSVCVLSCRKAKTLSIMTGPPRDRRMDAEMSEAFLRSDGAKAVCGGTTANMLARCTGRAIEPMADDIAATSTLHTPPRFVIKGIDLVTEGAVTLTQTLNVLDLHDRRSEATSAVSQLLGLLYEADNIRFYLGRAENAAGDDVLMRQLGVRQRMAVVQRLKDALTKMNKLVTVQYY